MSTIQKTFRQTAFNGYNRDDVHDYIRKQDELIRKLEDEAKEHLDSENAELEAAREEIARLNQQIGEMNETVESVRNENLDLSSQVMNLNNTILEKTTAIQEKNDVIESLKKELEEYKAKSEEKEQKINEQNERLTELGTRNEQIGNDLKTYIEQSERLKREAEGDLLAGSRLRELESAVAERDARIKFLEQSWNQHKNDYNVYAEVKKNVETIIGEAKKKAETICEEADAEAKKKLENAEEERGEIFSKTVCRLAQLKLSAQNIVTAIETASDEMEKKIPEKSEEPQTTGSIIPDDLLKLLSDIGNNDEQRMGN